MNSYTCSQTPLSNTICVSIVLSGLMIGQATGGAGHNVEDNAAHWPNAPNPAYETNALSASNLPERRYGTYSQVDSANQEFAAEVSEFYESLLSRQESLGQEFETVLYRNLSELYEA